MKILLTVEELAKYLKIKPDTIYKKVRKGELPAIKLGKLVRFQKDLIDQWISEQATKTMKEVNAARHAVESKVEEVRKTAKAASKAATKAIGDMPEIIEDLRNAPLNKKQAALTKGLKTLLKDWNSELGSKRNPPSRAKRSTGAAKAKKKSVKKAGSRASAVKVAAAPIAPSSSN